MEICDIVVKQLKVLTMTSIKRDKEVINVYATQEEKTAIRVAAALEGKSMSSFIMEMVNAKLNNTSSK